MSLEVSYAKASQTGRTRNLTSCHYSRDWAKKNSHWWSRHRLDFVSRPGTIALETETSIYAWALMSNHAHILLRSGISGLPQYMRRLLSGNAIMYNRRHRRHGHLFQNRYKSIICKEDLYFKELVRYIHLNPLRVNLVDDVSHLNWQRNLLKNGGFR